jgi:hypothetical protein
MDEIKKFVTVDLDGQIFKLETALVGGKIHGDPEYPIAFYAGKVTLEEIGMSLLHALRAVIKIHTDVHDFSLRQSEEFIIYCLEEALKREHRRLTHPGEDNDTVMRVTKHNL